MTNGEQNFGKRVPAGLRTGPNCANPASDQIANCVEKPRPTEKGQNSLLVSAKMFVGFIIGMIGGFALECAVLLSLSNILSSSDGSTMVPRGPGLIMIPMATGSAVAAAFKRHNLGIVVSRITFGMNPRLPVAIFVSWLLALNSYLMLFKDSFVDWYDQNSVEYWAVTFVVPFVVILILTTFRWAAPAND
jgi:hypothetical protein